jgi:hypothetical protein
MATPFGNPASGLYPLGKMIVAVPGTPIPLNTNVPITTSWGTPAAGIPGYTTKGVLSQLCCNGIIVSAPSTNTGDVFLVFKAQGYNGTGGSSVVICVAKGTTQQIVAPAGSNPFQLDQLGVDAVTANDVAFVTAVIVN